MSRGSSKRIIKNAGAPISMLNSASMHNDFSEGAFLFIQFLLEAIILFPGIRASNDRFADVSLDQFSIGRVYRRRSASKMTPAATNTKTMTTPSASTQARVSYQLFQSSSMRPRSKARLAKSTVERTCLCDQKCNATFGRALFDRAATWLMSSVRSGEAAT